MWVIPVQVLLEARHLLFSLASPVSQLVPNKAQREALVRARDKALHEYAADISSDFWRAARPAADIDVSDEKLSAAKLKAVVCMLSTYLQMQ